MVTRTRMEGPGAGTHTCCEDTSRPDLLTWVLGGAGPLRPHCFAEWSHQRQGAKSKSSPELSYDCPVPDRGPKEAGTPACLRCTPAQSPGLLPTESLCPTVTVLPLAKGPRRPALRPSTVLQSPAYRAPLPAWLSTGVLHLFPEPSLSMACGSRTFSAEVSSGTHTWEAGCTCPSTHGDPV